MNILDVEIYIKQFIDFFEKNHNDLIDLIGDKLKENFYQKVKEQCIKNYNNGDDVSLTRQQIINIVVNLKQTDESKLTEKIINKIFQNTKYGLIYLN